MKFVSMESKHDKVVRAVEGKEGAGWKMPLKEFKCKFHVRSHSHGNLKRKRVNGLPR